MTNPGGPNPLDPRNVATSFWHEDDGWHGKAIGVPGCLVRGATLAEAMTKLVELQRQMALARRIMDEDHDVLAALAALGWS